MLWLLLQPQEYCPVHVNSEVPLASSHLELHSPYDHLAPESACNATVLGALLQDVIHLPIPPPPHTHTHIGQLQRRSEINSSLCNLSLNAPWSATILCDVGRCNGPMSTQSGVDFSKRNCTCIVLKERFNLLFYQLYICFRDHSCLHLRLRSNFPPGCSFTSL